MLFVRGGRLAMLEGYTYAGNHWPADAVVISIEDVVPAFQNAPIPGDRHEFLTEEHRPWRGHSSNVEDRSVRSDAAA